MNKHIELVKKWIENPDSVTQEELDSNAADAWAATDAAVNAARAAAYAADAACDAADWDTYAAYWVKKYEEKDDQ